MYFVVFITSRLYSYILTFVISNIILKEKTFGRQKPQNN